MAFEYRLILAGEVPIDEVAARAIPNEVDRLDPYRGILSARLRELGLAFTVRSGLDGYFSAEADAGPWEWEPDAYVAVTCDIDYDDVDNGTRSMLMIVSRLLSTGSEDAALVLDGDHLLLTRIDGVLRKHSRAAWWDDDNNVEANEIIAG